MKWMNLVLAACIICGVSFLSALGFWQLKRLAEKEALIARVESNMNNAPLSVAEVEGLLQDKQDIEYRPATATGHFLHEREAHFFATHNGKPGYFIFTPLKRADDTLLMVNRGFVPIHLKAVALRQKGQIKGQVRIIGLARSAPDQRPNSFVPDNDLQKNVFYWKSLSEMVKFGGKANDKEVKPFFLDANDAPNVGGLPQGGTTLISFPNNHLQYAWTWFGLAATLVIVGGIFFRSRLRAGNL